MAKSSNRGGGEGTNDRGGVRSTLSPPFKSSGKGTQGTLNAPFNAPRAGGDNGLPTKIYDSLGGPSKGATANSRDSLDTIKTNPKGPRR